MAKTDPGPYPRDHEQHWPHALPLKVQKKAVDQPGKIISGLSTIENTGEGLIHFIEEYRKLSSLPPPEKSNFTIRDLFDQVQSLFSEECKKEGIQFEVHPGPANLQLFADRHQLELVMVNLIKNALDSLKESPGPVLTLSAANAAGKIRILVEDNGPGIPDAIKEQIFVPFYTTKNRGSGIGLSLSRQIMNKHNGSIHFTSIPGEKTVFSLSF